MKSVCFLILLIGVSGTYSHHWRLFDKGDKHVQSPPKPGPTMTQPPKAPIDCPSMTTERPRKQNTAGRPCKLDDVNCMSQFLASNSKCSRTRDRISDDTTMNSLLTVMPGLNITVFLPALLIKGLKSAKIEEFSVSAASNNLVIGINLQNIQAEVADATMYIHRRARESIIKNTPASIDLPSFTLTVIIPSVPHLRLEDAEINTFFDAEPRNMILGMASEPMDQLTQRVLESMMANPTLVLKEVIPTRLLAYYIIQNRFCDFGLVD